MSDKNSQTCPHSGSDRVNRSYLDKSKRGEYLILVPDMLPIHFKLIIAIYEQYGYRMKLLETSTRHVIDEGLKNVHNDTCYPALLVIGQFMDALKSGEYDLDHTALLISQTGGGCRASNYIHLLRKALSAEYPQIPVLSLNFSGLEKDSSLEVTPVIALKLIYAVLYGDMLMLLYNQCKPYETVENSTDELLARWEHRMGKLFHTKKDYMYTGRLYKAMLRDFAALPRKVVKKPKVGIVGEIYVKYSPLANNHLNELLLSEVLGTEADSVMQPWEEETDRTILRRAVEKLPGREKKIVKLRFGLEGGREQTQKEVADSMGISQSYISRLEKRIIARLRYDILQEIG